MIHLLEHNASGATIRMDQRELLLVMALIQEGRESFGCNTETGKSLDSFFSSTNLLVEEARRQTLKTTMMRQRIGIVASPDPALQKDASNG
jgi:hypothetical protein